MKRRRQAVALSLVATAAVLLAACAARHPRATAPVSAPAALTAPYAAAAAAGSRVYRLDAARSRVLVLVDKAGALAHFGHRHVIEVSELRGFALIAPDGAGRANLVFPVASLKVDPPALRKSLGKRYSEPLDESARTGTRKHMLGKSVLDAARYPRVRLAIVAPSGQNQGHFTVRITLHGTSRTIDTDGKIVRRKHTLATTGSFSLKQTDFGIVPYSVGLGMLRISNRLRIEYRLIFRRWCAVSSC